MSRVQRSYEQSELEKAGHVPLCSKYLVNGVTKNPGLSYNMCMSLKFRNILLWVSVLPGAILGGFSMTFPLHWVLYGTLVSGSVVSGVNIEPIERFLSPFIIALGFVLIGSHIAPAHKLKTAIVLTIVYIISFISVFIIMYDKATLELRGVGALIGVCLGLFIVWKKYKTDQSVSNKTL